ncbi:MAG: ATPase V [Bacteroidaceae bacterium]|nr:ATPase V [Bacteroidaceae bacterium]
MITRMKKLTFLVFYKEYKEFLERLRDLGVVHIAKRQQGEPDEDLHAKMQLRALYTKTLQEFDALSDDKVVKQSSVMKIEEVLAVYEEKQQDLIALNQEKIVIEKDLKQLESWGDFSWDNILRLQDNGWYVRFYSCLERDYKQEWEDEYAIIHISHANGTVSFLVVSKEPVSLDMEPVSLPKKSMSELTEDLSSVVARILLAEQEMASFAQLHRATVVNALTELEEDINMTNARLNGESMAEGALVLLEGWIPEDCEPEVRSFLDESGCYYEVRKATKEDNAPVKFKNNAFVRMYESITKMYGIPTYGEFDPTPLVAPFFTLFFAFCLGDAGYGILLVLGSLLLKKKVGPDMRGLLNLVLTLGVATTILGTVFGTFFGVNLYEANIPQWMKDLMFTGKIAGTTYDKQMLLALAIGVIHISIAMGVKAVGATMRFGFKESLSNWGWFVVVVGSVIVASLMLLNILPAEISKWAFIIVGIIGAIGIFLLNNPRRNVFVNIGAGLWDTYSTVSGLASDILSYVRLYALGLAGGSLGSAFNLLAGMASDGLSEIPFVGVVLGWIFGGVILVFGHTINIALSCLSAYVHPLRLTFVEYFKNSGYEGTGEEYAPFSVTKKENQ